ncbi:MAG: hypothetical protein RQ842_10550 [Vulcanisaeta sp.]|nr:hypothetical protein [Vulcanisaeta sp.]
MPRNGPAVILVLGSGKGGAGASTITANLAVLLMSRTNQPIAVIDAGIGPNATLSKLLGAGYATARQCEAGGLYEYMLDQSGLPQVKILMPNKLYLVPPGCLGTPVLHWHLPQLIGRFANDPDAFGQYVLGKLAKLYASLGARIILVDLPSATIRPFVWAFVVSADVINIVTLFGDTHIAEAQETLDIVSQILRAYNPHARVNLVINRVLNVKGGGSLVHFPTAGLNVFKLADSVEVRAWTDICGKPAVFFTRYAKGQDFRLWWSEVERLAKTNWNQVGEALKP